jgi:alpha-glucosidase
MPVPTRTAEWWRSAVVYQIYPRSFADSDGDGVGDLNGVRPRLGYLADLGVDAIWISPWYPSPLLDGGYDVSDYRDINPEFGTLADADALIADAHRLGMRVLIDLVPNHCSWEHPWFVAAVAAGRGSPERDLFWFRDGADGPDGTRPPNGWSSSFGGPAWEQVADGQWYLHLFDVSQPDWNWDNPRVVEEFDSILRFWFERGVDGFRIDVADSMAKDRTLPEVASARVPGQPAAKYPGHPHWDRDEVHEIHRRWRRIGDSYGDTEQGVRCFVAEAWVTPPERLARYLRHDELQSAFNFDALRARWDAASQRDVIDGSTQAIWAVGADATWVLSNHDTIRHRTRYGRDQASVGAAAGAVPSDLALGLRRARAAALLELALPGSAYIFQGDELGLPEVEDLPESALDDPIWERSRHTVRGRDGCRVPVPWSGTAPPFGFGPGTGQPWLPQPDGWVALTAAAQAEDSESHLTLYRTAVRLRRSHSALGAGRLEWVDVGSEALCFDRQPGFRCVVNFATESIDLPPHREVLLTSVGLEDGRLPSDAAAWLAT